MSEARRSRAIGMLILATPCWALSFPVMKALTLAQQNLLPGAGTWFISSLCVMLRFLIAGNRSVSKSPLSNFNCAR